MGYNSCIPLQPQKSIGGRALLSRRFRLVGSSHGLRGRRETGETEGGGCQEGRAKSVPQDVPGKVEEHGHTWLHHSIQLCPHHSRDHYSFGCPTYGIQAPQRMHEAISLASHQSAVAMVTCQRAYVDFNLHHALQRGGTLGVGVEVPLQFFEVAIDIALDRRKGPWPQYV